MVLIKIQHDILGQSHTHTTDGLAMANTILIIITLLLIILILIIHRHMWLLIIRHKPICIGHIEDLEVISGEQPGNHRTLCIRIVHIQIMRANRYMANTWSIFQDLPKNDTSDRVCSVFSPFVTKGIEYI